MFKVNNKNIRKRCEVNNKDRRRSGIFIVNFEHISHFVLVFLLLTLSRKMPARMLILYLTIKPSWRKILISKNKKKKKINSLTTIAIENKQRNSLSVIDIRTESLHYWLYSLNISTQSRKRLFLLLYQKLLILMFYLSLGH